MSDDLKGKFEQLVADPPPPNGVPSEAVFARVRSVRRRRTAGVVTLAAAAVVAVAVAAGNLTDINSSPPVTGTPGASTTVVTGPPTATQTSPKSFVTKTPDKPSTPGNTTGAGATTTTETTTTHTPAQPPLDVNVVLKPAISGRTVTMDVTVSGTVLVPLADGKNLPSDTSFLNLSFGTNYTWGDGKFPGGSDAGAVTCEKAKKRTTGSETYPIDSHTYTKPGTYTFTYTVRYCGTDGPFETSKTTKLVIK
ncbi:MULTISPECIES: hypothetical protein [unclassified Kribbella]|uniref:hypothetical protein n=1 Tax=unclassified Kribbella TaxID=2644121 RepID=UPI0030169647